MNNPEYPIVVRLRTFLSASYCDYLQKAISEHVAKGHYSEEYAQAMTTADLYRGNDGD